MRKSLETQKRRSEKARSSIIRCAIYTRKSTSEGFDQDFTSLDAQREAGENYIASQKNMGWMAMAEKYDDGGFSGATTDRPALTRLLADIRSAKIDCVVVYKVDRLSRSLLDFVQLLELFEKQKVAFVSVTQHFNTNDSMGRLTLNILLSFAQFEREIISERTRDKMAAARKKGKWIGGRPPIGYDRDKEKKALVVNEQEAEIVRAIFTAYLEEGAISGAVKRLNAQGIRNKTYCSDNGRITGGGPINKSSLQQTLRNVLYIGKVTYNGTVYPGLHKAILSNAMFEKVQAMLDIHRDERQATKHTTDIGILSRALVCASCRTPMIYTYANKNGHKYRYYVCSNAQKNGYANCPEPSIRAQAMDTAAIACLRRLVCPNEKHPALFRKTRERLFIEIEKLREKLVAAQRQGGFEWRTIEDELMAKEDLCRLLLISCPEWDTTAALKKNKIVRQFVSRFEYDGEKKVIKVHVNEATLNVIRKIIEEA